MARYSCFVVDAFTRARYAGNPAAVVLDAAGLSDQQLQSIAAEFNLSETAYVLPPQAADAKIRVRWMTPSVEVELCGHATLGSLHALVDSGRLDVPPAGETLTVPIETKSGVLSSFIERLPGDDDAAMYWLDLPDVQLHSAPFETTPLLDALGLQADAIDPVHPPRSTDAKVFLFVRDVATLNAMAPDFAALKSWQERVGLHGLTVATVNTLTPAIHVQSRFFAPALGVDEDPVTGSAHGPLAACLADFGRLPEEGGLMAASCVQGIAGGRAGLVHVLVQRQEDGRYATRIGGRVVTVLRGEIEC